MNAAASGIAAEPLEKLARFGWQWAGSLCRPEHGCVDYHRSWSLVRLLELGGALPAGAESLRQAVAPLAAAGRARVLVSGGADTGVTAMVAGAFRAHGVQPEIVFVDRCRTTCVQNELFAAHAGLQVQVLQCDVGDIDVPPVDAVVAHSFLQLLPAVTRQRAVEAWARVLAPGGIVWTSGPLRQHENDAPPARDAARVAARRVRIEQLARDHGFDASAASEIGACAERFWLKSSSQPPSLTEESVRASFARAGLEVRTIARHDPLDAPGTLGIPDAQRRPRAEIVAVRLCSGVQQWPVRRIA
jgi:hypothetical protein